jgi:hypothetical protein
MLTTFNYSELCLALSRQGGTMISHTIRKSETEVWRSNTRKQVGDHFFSRYWPFFLLIVLAVILRSPVYGDPDVGLDEEFYLVVADRMIHGAIPYVDIWDRKPIGLFLIYASTRLLGGEGFAQYQVVAAIFSGSTAGYIWLISRRSASNFGAILAALAYIFWLNIFSGSAGQSPVFYNLFIAAAAHLAFRSNDYVDLKRVSRSGYLAMILCGVAIQVKYTAVVESAFIGLWFLWRTWKTSLCHKTVISRGMIYATIGLIPTISACLFYNYLGHFNDFYYANFLSIFHRGNLGDRFLRNAKIFFLTVTMPIAIYLPFSLVQRSKLIKQNGKDDFYFLAGWLIAASVGFCMIGNFYDHYILPLLVPVFISISPLFSRPFVGIPSAGMLIGWSILLTDYPKSLSHDLKKKEIYALTNAVLPYVRNHCLFIFDGPAVIYMTTQACIPTRYAYPDHLSNDVEKDSIGADTVAEMHRILNSKPGAIITAEGPVIPTMNQQTLPIIRHALTSDYIPVAAINHPYRIFYVYARRDLVRGPGINAPIPYQKY